MERFKVAAIQFEVKPGEKKANLDMAERMLHEAYEDDVKLAVFPEYAWTGYPDLKFAETIPGGTCFEHLSSKAREYSMYIVSGTIIEKVGEDYYLTNVLINPEGEIVGKQGKTSLMDWRWSTKKRGGANMKNEVGIGIKPGKKIEPFETDLGCIGMLFGADMDPPEPARTLVLRGAEILAVSASVQFKSTHDELYFWARCRAWENSAYVIIANRVGEWRNSPAGDLEYAGYSQIASPRSEIISLGSKLLDQIVVAYVDIKELREFRKDHSLLWLRYPKAYDLDPHPEFSWSYELGL